MTDSTFDNPSAGFASGPHRGRRAAHRRGWTPHAAARRGALHRRRRRRGHGGGLLAVDRTLSDALRGELGMRFARPSAATPASRRTQLAARGKLRAQWPKHPELQRLRRARAEPGATARRLAAVGGEYRFTSRGRLYVRHELISSLLGPDRARRQRAPASRPWSAWTPTCRATRTCSASTGSPTRSPAARRRPRSGCATPGG